MTYYQVKAADDGCKTRAYLYKPEGKTFYREGYLIQDELYTEKEKEKLHIPDAYLKKIEVSQRNTFFSFGARFIMQSGGNPLFLSAVCLAHPARRAPNYVCRTRPALCVPKTPHVMCA